MKNKMIMCAFVIGASIASAQSSGNQVKVRVKKVEKVNGVEKISDTIYYVDEATALKGSNNEIFIETTEDEKAIDTAIEKAMKEAGHENAKVVIFKECDQNGQ